MGWGVNSYLSQPRHPPPPPAILGSGTTKLSELLPLLPPPTARPPPQGHGGPPGRRRPRLGAGPPLHRLFHRLGRHARPVGAVWVGGMVGVWMGEREGLCVLCSLGICSAATAQQQRRATPADLRRCPPAAVSVVTADHATNRRLFGAAPSPVDASVSTPPVTPEQAGTPLPSCGLNSCAADLRSMHPCYVWRAHLPPPPSLPWPPLRASRPAAAQRPAARALRVWPAVPSAGQAGGAVGLDLTD